MDTLNTLFNIFKVALGLGFVIFLHELGHFLLAKWNGVKVETFSIGFGPALLGFKKGETDYILAAVPLGGYVKMLGEGPEGEASKSTDPRAFPNKSVGARMAIISAGVVMNLILGLVCFVYAYGQGMEEVPAMVGGVVAGTASYETGMRAGDEIVSIDGRRDLTFSNMILAIRLSRQGQVLHFEVKRPGQDALIPMNIEPRREANADVPGIGVYPGEHLKIERPPYQYRTPSGTAEPVKDSDKLLPGDKVIAVGPVGETPTEVKDVPDWHRLLSKLRDKALSVTLERRPRANKDQGETTEGPPARVSVTLPPNRFVDFGFRLKAEPIAAIRGGSPAQEAGFQKGDVILKVDGRDDFDPMRLPTVCYEKAGQPMTFEVSRREADGSTKVVTLTVTPDDTPPWTALAFPNEPLDLSGIGVALPVRTKIEAITQGSPADKAGLKPGDVITALTLPRLTSPKESESGLWARIKGLFGKSEANGNEIKFDDRPLAWPTVFRALQFLPLGEVTLTVNNSNKAVKITPEADPTWFHPNRGEQFETFSQKMPPMAAVPALKRGFEDTVDNILSIYAMFRSLAQSRVSPKQLGGPIMIFNVAHSAAASSLTDLVHFLGILSINLAVLNFLPIPPLDGGQMVFLIAEKVRGRPLPESALAAGTYLGLFLVLGLMAYVIFQDISRYVIG